MIDEPKAEAAASQFLSFLIGHEECAVDLLQVREIVRYVSATRVPRVATCVRGVVNLRGDVVPVIDVAVGLGVPAAPVTAQTCLAVVEVMVGGEKTVVGLITDAVIQLFDLRPDDIEPAPSFGTQVPAAFLLGAARADGRLVLLLNLDRLLGEGSFLHGPGTGPVVSPLHTGDIA